MGTGAADSKRQHEIYHPPFKIERIGNAVLVLGDNTGPHGIDNPAMSSFYGIDCTDMCTMSDPPYGVEIMTDMDFERKTGTGQGKTFKPVHGNDEEFDPTPWLIGKEQILWGHEHYGHRLPHRGRILTWDKRCQVVPPRNQACFESAWCSVPGAGRMFYHVWDGFLRDSEKGQERMHPTQKPVALMEWCLQFTQCKTIFDPFMGSGTTGVAAVKAGRQFIGIEIEQEYFDVACERIAKAQNERLREYLRDKQHQVDLFV